MELPTLDKFPKRVLAQIDIQTAFMVSRLIVAAERLQVFRALRGKRMTAEAIGKSVKIHRFYLRPFLNSLVSLGLLRKREDTYWNTPFADRYFVGERPIYWTRQFSAECVQNYAALTVLEQVLASGKSYQEIQGLQEPNYLERMQRDRREAEDFTQMLFHLHQGDAAALADCLDLSGHRAVLDVGGGSGVMSIALAKKNPHLHACILDLAPVCEVAARNAKRARLSRRVRTLAGNIRQALPAGYDVVLLCDVGAVPDALLRNAFDCLPAGGLLVLVDRFFSDDGTRPLDRLVAHFTGSSFGLATKGEMVRAVKASGFRGIKARNIHQDLWLVTGFRGSRTW